MIFLRTIDILGKNIATIYDGFMSTVQILFKIIIILGWLQCFFMNLIFLTSKKTYFLTTAIRLQTTDLILVYFILCIFNCSLDKIPKKFIIHWNERIFLKTWKFVDFYMISMMLWNGICLSLTLTICLRRIKWH